MAERSTLKPVSASSVPSLVPQGEQAGKPAMPLGRPFTLIGSRNRAHLHLLSSSISRNHASLISTDTGLYLRDLSSRTGVLLNGRRVKESDLRDGDVVQVGSFRFRFTDPSGASRLGITPRPAAAMLEMDGATLTPIDGRTILIGRRPTCDIALPEASVSNTHCLIFEANGHRFIRDLGSRTGTLVNGKPVHHQQLEFGDEIRVGDTEFRFLSAAPTPQPLELEAEDLAHDEDEEPIGLAFEDEQQAQVARVEAIPEADADDLLPEQAEVEPDLEPIALTPEAGEFAEPIAPVEARESEPSHAEAEDPDIDFEIAGSQLDLQKKLAETSRLAVEESQPPLEAVVGSDEPLRPAQDLGLDFLDEEFSTPPPEPAAEEQPVEEPVSAEHAAPLVHEDSDAPVELSPAHQEPTAESAEARHGLTSDELAIAEPEATTSASEPAALDSELTAPEATSPQVESEPVTPEPQPAEPQTEWETPQSQAIAPESEGAAAEPEGQSPQPQASDLEPEAPSDREPHELQPEAEAEAPPAAPAPVEVPAAEAEPIAVDQIDLSSVNFREESPAAVDDAPSAAAEEAADTESEPRPLLDLAPEAPTAEPPAEPPAAPVESPLAQDEPAIAAVEPPVPAEPMAEAEPTAEAELTPATQPPSRYRKPSRRSRRRKGVEAPVDAPALADALSLSEAASVAAPAGGIVLTGGPVELPEPAPEQVSSSVEVGEVIPSSDPTPDSAQELGEAIELTAPADAAAETAGVECATTDPLTDTAFGRIVDEFTGPESPALIEEPAERPEPRPQIELASEQPLELAPPAARHSPPTGSAESSPNADAQATTPDEPLADVPEATISEPVATPLELANDAVDFGPDEPAQPRQVTSDVSIDDVIELDSSSLMDEPQVTPVGPAAPEPPGLELADGPAIELGEVQSQPEAESAGSEAPAEPVDAPPPHAIDPFFGMERDMGSFLGGHPLALPTAPVITTPFAQSRIISPEFLRPAAPAPQPPSRPVSPEPPPAPDEPAAVLPPPAPPEPASAGPAPAMWDAPAVQPPPLTPAPPEAAREPQAPEPDFDEFPSLPEDLAEIRDEPAGASAWMAPEPSAESVSSHVAPQPDEVAEIDDLPDLGSLDAPQEKLSFSAEPEAIPPLDDLLADDSQPLELFDGTADKLDEMPDALEAIGDVSGALAEEPAAPAPRVVAEPPPLPAPPRAPEPAAKQPPAKPVEKPAPRAPAPSPAAAKPKIKPPPPPRTSPLRASSLSNPFDALAGEVPISDDLPPFAGQRAGNLGQGASFDGLSGAPVREADVFSHEAFTSLDDVFFGAPSAGAPEIPPANKQPARGKAGAQPPAPAGGPQSLSGPAGPTPPAARKPRDRNRDRIPPNRQALPRQGQPLPARPLAASARPLAPPPLAAPPADVAPPPPGAPPGGAKRVPWWKKVRTLLPLMILCLAGAWAGILLGIPQKHSVEGTLRFAGMDGFSPPQERELADSVRQMLRNPEVRQAIDSNARTSGAPGGFLDDPVAMDNLSHADFEQPDHSEFSESHKALVLVHSSTRPELDRVRMRAILAVLYQQDGARRDTASTAQHQLQDAQDKADALRRQRDLASSKLSDLENQVRAAGGTPSDAQLKGPALWADQLDHKDKELWAAWQKAITHQADAQAALERAQTAPPDAPAAARADVDADPQIRRLKASIDSLATRLRAAQENGNGSSAQAAQDLDAALARVDEQLASIGDPDAPAVEAYLGSAKSTRDEVRQLAGRIQSETQTARQLQEQLSQTIAARQDSDPALHDLLRDRDMYEHRYEAASGSGLAEDATKIKGVLDELDHKIEARRQALAIGGAAAADHQPAGDSLKQLQADRRRDAQRMRDRVDRPDRSAPSGQAIPQALQPQVGELAKRVSGLAAAGERYASAITDAPSGAREVGPLQSQLAAAQEQLERQRKELADAAAQQWSRQQQQARAAAVAGAGKALALATAGADQAASDYASNRKLLSTVRELADQKMAYTEIDQKLQLADEDLAQRKGTVSRVATVAAPDDNSVSVTYGKDNRLPALAGVSVVIVLFFGGLMWFGSSPAQAPHVPFANAVAIAHEVPGHHPEEFASDGLLGQDDREPIVA